jgi:hypothetical protein
MAKQHGADGEVEKLRKNTAKHGCSAAMTFSPVRVGLP